MTEFVRELFSKGKVTIPHEIRDLYDLKDGDYVRLKVVGVVRAGVTDPSPARAEEAIEAMDHAAGGSRRVENGARPNGNGTHVQADG